MTLVEFVSRFFPSVLLGVVCINALVWWVRGGPDRKAFPERRRSYLRIIAWFVGYTALISFFGQLEFLNNPHTSIFEFVKFESIGIFGKIAGGLILLVSPLLAVYIYVFKGANELSKHPGLFGKGTSESLQRAFWMLIPVIVFVSHALFVLQLGRFAG